MAWNHLSIKVSIIIVRCTTSALQLIYPVLTDRDIKICVSSYVNIFVSLQANFLISMWTKMQYLDNVEVHNRKEVCLILRYSENLIYVNSGGLRGAEKVKVIVNDLLKPNWSGPCLKQVVSHLWIFLYPQLVKLYVLQRQTFILKNVIFTTAKIWRMFYVFRHDRLVIVIALPNDLISVLNLNESIYITYVEVD